MPFIITCDACKSRIRVADNAVGRKANCPKCSTSFLVVAPPTEDPQRVASATAAQKNKEPNPTWYINTGASETRQVSWQHIVGLAQAGELQPDSLIRNPHGDWLVAGQIDGLQQYLNDAVAHQQAEQGRDYKVLHVLSVARRNHYFLIGACIPVVSLLVFLALGASGRRQKTIPPPAQRQPQIPESLTKAGAPNTDQKETLAIAPDKKKPDAPAATASEVKAAQVPDDVDTKKDQDIFRQVGKSSLRPPAYQPISTVRISPRSPDSTTCSIEAAAVTADKRRCAVLLTELLPGNALESQIIVVDVVTGKQIYTIPCRAEKVSAGGGLEIDNTFTCLQFTPDNRYLVTGDFAGTIDVWTAEFGHSVKTIKGHAGTLLIAVSPDSRRVSTTGADNTVKAWSIPSGDLLYTAPLPLRPGRLALSAKGEFLGVCGSVIGPDGTLVCSTAYVLDAADGRRLSVLESAHAVQDIAVSPDGRQIVMVSSQMLIETWAAADKKLMHTANARLPIWRVAYHPDGSAILIVQTSHEAASLELRDTSGEWVQQVLSTEREVSWASFSADAAFILAGGGGKAGGFLQVWGYGGQTFRIAELRRAGAATLRVTDNFPAVPKRPSNLDLKDLLLTHVKSAVNQVQMAERAAALDLLLNINQNHGLWTRTAALDRAGSYIRRYGAGIGPAMRELLDLGGDYVPPYGRDVSLQQSYRAFRALIDSP